jgi:hypothetical protein
VTTIQSDRQHPRWVFTAPDKIVVATVSLRSLVEVDRRRC